MKLVRRLPRGGEPQYGVGLDAMAVPFAALARSHSLRL